MRITVVTVYTFVMPKLIYVQIRGAREPARIQAETLEKVEGGGGTLNRLILKNGETVIGEINGADIQGWWIEEEGAPGTELTEDEARL